MQQVCPIYFWYRHGFIRPCFHGA